MKKCLWALIGLLGMTAIGQENIVKNADWKEIGANGAPVGWSIRAEVIAEHGGDDRADFTLSRKDGKEAIVTYPIKIEPNVPYVFSYEMKCAEEAMVQNYLEWHWPENGAEVYRSTGAAKFHATKDWKTYKASFSYATESTSGYIALRSTNGAKIQFRNLVVRKARLRRDEGTGGQWNLENVDSFTDDSVIVKGGKSAVLYGIPVKEGMTYRLSYDAIGIGEVDPAFPFHEISTRIEPRVQGAFAFNDVANSTQRKFQKFTVPANSGVTSVSVTFGAKTKAAIGFSNFKLETIVPDPRDAWRLEVVEPFYRNTLYSSNLPEKIRFRVHTDGTPHAVNYSFTNSNGTRWLNGLKIVNIALDLQKELMPDGKHILSCDVVDKDGKVLKHFEETILKVPSAPIEIIGQPNRYFTINGKPFFPIVQWSIRSHDDDFLYYAARHGVNCCFLHFSADEEANIRKLDQLNKFGIKAIVPMGYAEASPAMQETLRKRLEERLTPAIRRHPSLFGYFMVDEPLWGGKSYGMLQASYETYREVDPYHPVWINAAPRNEVEDLRPYGEACDIWGCDIYPIPSPNSHSGIEDKTMTSVGKYCLRMDDTTWNRKPIWMALQGFGWGENPENGPNGRAKVHPSLHEMRFMAFDAMLNACTGYGLWGTNFVKSVDFMETIYKTTEEVHRFSGVTMNGKPLPPPKASDAAIRVNVLEVNGQRYAFIMNVTDKPVKGTTELGNGTWREITASEGQGVMDENGVVSVDLKPYGFVICGTAELPPPIMPLPPANEELEKDGSPVKRVIEAYLFKLENTKYFKTKASWIWSGDVVNQAGSTCFVGKEFTAKAGQKVVLKVAVDDLSTVYLNGRQIGKTQDWNILHEFDLSKELQDGQNVLIVRGSDSGGLPCGVLAELHVDGQIILSGNDWLAKSAKATEDPPATLDGFQKAHIVCPYGGGAWRENVLTK